MAGHQVRQLTSVAQSFLFYFSRPIRVERIIEPCPALRLDRAPLFKIAPSRLAKNGIGLCVQAIIHLRRCKYAATTNTFRMYIYVRYLQQRRACQKAAQTAEGSPPAHPGASAALLSLP
jgi:hypothetical protein